MKAIIDDIHFRIDCDPTQLLFLADGTPVGAIPGLSSYFINDKEVTKEEYEKTLKGVIEQCNG